MGFLAPWFLAGLTALAVPVYVHLLKQHKTTPLPFSSLMFFEHRIQSSVKHRRLKYLLLFALRVATIALIALTFAGFYLGCSGTPMTKNRLTVVAIDRSLSMKAGNRIGAAKKEAAGVVRSMTAAGQVVAFDSQSAV